MRTRNDPWNTWNLVTASGALLFLVLWLLVSALGRGSVASEVTPTINALAAGDVTVTTLALSGTGAPNSKLQVRIGDKIIGPVAVGADGGWSTEVEIAQLPTKKITVLAEALGAEGQVSASPGALELTPELAAKNAVAFYYPRNNEKLDARDYALFGRGIPGDQLEIWQTTPSGTVMLETVTVGVDGYWNGYVPPKNPGTRPGFYTYALRKPGSPEVILERTVIVKKRFPKASNARCPCRMQIFTNRMQKITDSTVTLFNDGRRTDERKGNRPFINLGAGRYTYEVTAPGYQDYSVGKILLPKNKNIEVYLEPQR
jgi:hypothetical protein